MDKKAAFSSVCAKFSKDAASAFVLRYSYERFRNWKKTKTRFSEHEHSERNSDDIAMHRRNKGDLDVNGQLKKELSSLQVIRKNGLSHLHTVRVLLRQRISLQGHCDEE